MMRFPRLDWTRFGPRIGWLLAVTVVVVLFMLTGYTWLWESTTGLPYTHLMRNNPWLLPLLALPAVSLLVRQVEFTWRGRITVAWGIGGVMFLAGHVYW